ncbi:MAG: nicotinate-nucleotide--dimethylbenzimidazole phosphoribosyltransferase, partial [Pygmaiobacter sp.]
QPADVGLLNAGIMPGVWEYRVRNGTADSTKGAAMSRAQCVQAIEYGAAMAKRLADEGVQILATGEMGIGNTTTSSAVASVLLHRAAAEVTGRGAGLSDEGLCRKIAAIETSLAVNSPNENDAVDVLCKVGGLDLAGLCGVFLGGAACRVPVVIDGFISAVAALCAVRICPAAAAALLASHRSAEPAGLLLLNELGVQPLITAQMRLGEGSGAVAVLPLLDMALAVYESGQTFQKLGIAAYTPQ